MTNYNKPEANYNMIDWFKKVVFDNYANFNGRARRSEFWWFRLCSGLLLLIPYIIVIMASVNNFETNEDLRTISTGLSASMSILVLCALLLLIPSLAVAVRRLHDTGKSGWMLLLGIIPFGGIALLVFYFQDGNRFTNQYGPDPNAPLQSDFDFEKQPQQNQL
jgi:uncharacterized membrane protein YhaH (DUF805 family)